MTNAPIILDGSLGEGGGQILRSALALSMVTGRPFRIDNIRAGREKPGLLRQHLTAVNAAATISSANVDGATLGSRSLNFSPGTVLGGTHTFSVGTAGSTTLVLQTVLPALMLAKEPSSLTLEGGTHNVHAPPFDFLERAFIPLINRMGPTVNVALERAGFYPAGGGRFFVQIQPVAKLSPLHLPERGTIQKRLAKGSVAGLPGDIAKRELKVVEKMLGWAEDELQIRQLPAEWGPGNILTLELQSEQVTEVFTAFGMKGVSAESVGNDAARQVRSYLADDAPVGHHLADQLLLPIALAGRGSFRTQTLTQHATTNIQVIQQFLPVKFNVTEGRAHQVIIDVS